MKQGLNLAIGLVLGLSGSMAYAGLGGWLRSDLAPYVLVLAALHGEYVGENTVGVPCEVKINLNQRKMTFSVETFYDNGQTEKAIPPSVDIVTLAADMAERTKGGNRKLENAMVSYAGYETWILPYPWLLQQKMSDDIGLYLQEGKLDTVSLIDKPGTPGLMCMHLKPKQAQDQ